MLKLRRINESVSMLERIGEVWRSKGWDAVLESPPTFGIWLPVADANHRWKGWLRLQDWLEYVSPQLAELAFSAGVSEQVLQWFSSVNQPLKFPMPELAYERLWLGEPFTGDVFTKGLMLRIMSNNGPLWLEQVPLANVDDKRISATLSWPLRFVIGESQISLALLKRISCGDVLVICSPTSRVRCYNVTLGAFEQTEKGILMDYQDLQENDNDDVLQEVIDVVDDMSRLPLRLEFVLHNHRVKLAELQNMYKGQLLSLPVGAELRVEVRGNGVRLGYGELVQLDAQLGVEVNEWLCESKDDE